MPVKTYGEATNAAERAVETVLDRLGQTGAPIADARYSRVEAGISNFNWLVDLNGSRIFLKICSGDAASPEKELAREASRLAGAMGIGPRQLQVIADLGAEIYEYLEGYAQCTVDMFLLDPKVRQRILAALRIAHDGPALSLTRTGFDQLHERVAHIGGQAAHLPADIDSLLHQCSLAEQAVRMSGMDIVPSHNDLYFANIMMDVQCNARIIDWEYAANNDRAWDLANLSMSAGGEMEPLALARDYGAADPYGLAARITLYRVVILVSWGIWAASQALESQLDYDYRQHSLLLLQSARYKIGHADWQDALRTVQKGI